MVDITVAKIYAEAVFLIALEKNKTEEFKKNLEEIKSVFSSNEELRKIFTIPVIPARVKHNIVNDIFASSQEDILNLLHVLIKKHRENLLDSVVNEYLKILDAQDKILSVEVYSAEKLTPEQKDKLSRELKEVLKSKIKMEEKVYPDLIGGIIVKTDDRVIDGSLRNYIEKFREKLIKA